MDCGPEPPPRAGSEGSTAATAVEIPRLRDAAIADGSDTGGSDDRSTDASFASTPEKALLLAEIERIKAFCLFVIPLTIAAGGVSFLVGGDPTARNAYIAGLALVAVTAGWMYWVCRDPESYRPWQNVLFGQACAIGVTGAIYYWGPFSAALLIIPFGAHIFSMMESVGAAAAITVTVMASHATISVLLITGTISDRSVVQVIDVSIAGQLVILTLIHSIFLATFAVARELRRSAQRSVEELDAVARAVARRDALLAEARQDLNRALQVGGPGPYTGQTVGSFELGPILGRGAMGEVYEAVHTGSRKPCAVKLLNPRMTVDSNHYKRFLREVEIAASLDVPNVVKVLEIATGEGSLPFLAMERLRGEDLSSYLKQQPRLPVAEVVDLIRQIGRGLSAAHALGVIHRDLKPHNLFRSLTDDGAVVWKVLDFGVSKLTGSEGTLTQGKVVGTPGYMAPEQARGEEVDHRADLYALGVIAYRTITGIPAFAAAGDVPKILYSVVYSMPQRPSAIADVGPAMDQVLAVAMAKQPADRFDSPDALADAIADADRGIVAPDVGKRARRLLARLPWHPTPRMR